MEESNKKEKGTYCVFKCSKCNNWLYAKITQKTTKCFRCRRRNSLPVKKEKLYEGITAAREEVRLRQNRIAMEKTKNDFNFHDVSGSDFSVKINEKNNLDFQKKRVKYEDLAKSENYAELFRLLLERIKERYSFFPIYVFSLLSADFHIPQSELKLQIKNSLKKKVIAIKSKEYFHFNDKNSLVML